MKPRPVFIEWVDSIGSAGWKTREEVQAFLSAPTEHVKSVGYLIHSDRNRVVIAQSLHYENRDHLMEIPRKAIVDMRDAK